MYNRIIFIAFLAFLSFSFLWGQAPKLEVYRDFDSFEKAILDVQDDKTYIVNLWATWCGPCVKELPYFEALNESLDEDYEVVLVSIDWEKNLERTVQPFIEKKGLKSKVVLFDDPRANSWIDKIDSSWSGAIPITLFINKERRQFYEKEYHSTKELENDLSLFLESK